MARIKRKGLEYFPMDTTILGDIRYRLLMKQEGEGAIAVLLSLFSSIYGGEGYYAKVDDALVLGIEALMYNQTTQQIRSIIDTAVKHGIFDTKMYDEHGVLTSLDIQQQFMYSTRRRSRSESLGKYCLIEEEESCEKARETAIEAAQTQAECAKLQQKENKCNKNHEIVYNGTHSIAQQSTAEHSKKIPPLVPPLGKEEEENLPSAVEVAVQRGKPSTGVTLSDIEHLQPPRDGRKRNFSGLLENLARYRIEPPLQLYLIRKSNFGMIGHPIWSVLMQMNGQAARIVSPANYLMSQLKKYDG